MNKQQQDVIVCRKREKRFLQLISRAFKPFSYQLQNSQMRQYSLKNMISCGCADYYFAKGLLPPYSTLMDHKAYVFGLITECGIEDNGETTLIGVHRDIKPYLDGMSKAFRLKGAYLTIDGKRYYLDDEYFINSTTLLGMFLLHVLKLYQTNVSLFNEISFNVAKKFTDEGQLRASLILAPIEKLSLITEFDSSSFELRNYFRVDFVFSARGLFVSSSGSRTKCHGNAQPCKVDFDGEEVEWI